MVFFPLLCIWGVLGRTVLISDTHDDSGFFLLFLICRSPLLLCISLEIFGSRSGENYHRRVAFGMGRLLNTVCVCGEQLKFMKRCW